MFGTQQYIVKALSETLLITLKQYINPQTAVKTSMKWLLSTPYYSYVLTNALLKLMVVADKSIYSIIVALSLKSTLEKTMTD